MYYKELVYIIMEDGKSRCLQGELATWRHRRINGSVPKALRSKTQEETMSWSSPKAGNTFLCLEEAFFLCLGEAFLVSGKGFFLGLAEAFLCLAFLLSSGLQLIRQVYPC